MTQKEFKSLKSDDKVKYFGKRYKFSYHIKDGYYLGTLQSIGGYIVNVREKNLERLERGWQI